MARFLRGVVSIAALGLMFALAGCGARGAPPSAHAPSASPWLTYQTRTKTAYLTVVAGYDAAHGGLNFDGYSNGRLVFRVPVGWNVTVRFVNRGQLPHSVAVTRADSTRPAFPGASVPLAELRTGLGPGQSTIFTFRPTATGSFRLACLVPGHEGEGMWDRFVVTAGGVPAVSP